MRRFAIKNPLKLGNRYTEEVIDEAFKYAGDWVKEGMESSEYNGFWYVRGDDYYSFVQQSDGLFELTYYRVQDSDWEEEEE